MSPELAQLAEDLQEVGVSFGQLYAAAYALRSQTVKLEHFQPHEFRAWWPFMDAGLLLGLDEFRGILGARVNVSKARGAMGRLKDEFKDSPHFPRPLVLAVDVMLPESSLEEGFQAACAAGFTGIGVYPDWHPFHGMHLDMRTEHPPGRPALWSARAVKGNDDKIKQVYGAIGDVIEDWQKWIR